MRKHCHVIFIHLWGQPLIVRSHSEVHQTWRHLLFVEKLQIFQHLVEKLQIFQHLVFIKILLHVFNHLVSVTKLRVIGHLVSVRKLRVIGHLVSVTKRHVFNHLESVTRLHVFNYLASVEKPQVFYYLVSDAKIFDISPRWSYFSLGDKPSGHTPTRVIIV